MKYFVFFSLLALIASGCGGQSEGAEAKSKEVENDPVTSNVIEENEGSNVIEGHDGSNGFEKKRKSDEFEFNEISDEYADAKGIGEHEELPKTDEEEYVKQYYPHKESEEHEELYVVAEKIVDGEEVQELSRYKYDNRVDYDPYFEKEEIQDTLEKLPEETASYIKNSGAIILDPFTQEEEARDILEKAVEERPELNPNDVDALIAKTKPGKRTYEERLDELLERTENEPDQIDMDQFD